LSRPLSPSDLDDIPRIGWIDEPTPVTPLPRTAAALGLEYLGAKRDDLGEALHGGNKPRKLDYLLAAPPFSEAPGWASMGGVGSGSMVALVEAARKLDRRVEAYLFWTSLTRGVVENLAFTASGPASIHFYRSRATLGLLAPSLFLAESIGGLPVVGPGASTPRGTIGSVRGGLELAAQIRSGEVPEPERVYVAYGSGGTAVGTAMGLALGGVRVPVAAIAVVERILATRGRERALERALARELEQWGIAARTQEAPLPIVIDHAHVGPGYAEVTRESLAACEALAAEGIALEPVYTGKAMAALTMDARRRGLKRAILWVTVRHGPLPIAPDWRKKLPAALARRLDAPVQDGPSAPEPAERGPVTRRRVIVAIGAAAVAGVGARVSGYPPLPGWKGEVLAAREAEVLAAAAEALLPPAAIAGQIAEIAARVDRMLVGMRPAVQREARGMLALIEHGTPLGRRWHRFTLLSVDERVAYLAGLEARGGVLAQAYRGLRDLCMLALYQQPSSWDAIGYEGPKMPLDYDPHGRARWAWAAYDAMVAPEHALPRGMVR
jgi:D-cysteine desulfhydrase